MPRPSACEGYPDRVVYAITDAGREVAREWLREMLRTTDNEYPEFLAALSILFGLPPEEARAELELRARAASAELAETEAELAAIPPGLPRLFLLEEEYREALLRPSSSWLSGVIEDLRDRAADLERGVAARGRRRVHHRRRRPEEDSR